MKLAQTSLLRLRSCAFHKVYLCTSDQPAETGGERPHKMKSPQTPFRTTRLARAWERLKLRICPFLRPSV